MRRIRIMGLGALMALAMMAVPAGASASGGIEADEYPVTLKGASLKSSHKLFFSNFGVQTTCPINLVTEIDDPSPAIVGDWLLSGGCKSFKANGCKLEFHPGTQNTFGFGPSGCGPVKFTVNGCPIALASQTLPATYTNVGEGKLAKLTASTAATFKWTSEAPVGWPCSSKGTYEGEINGTWDIVGRDAANNSVGIHATDLPYAGLYVTGEESEVEAAQPQFESERYPLPILGAQDPLDKLEFYSTEEEDGALCNVAQFDGDASGPTAELSLTAEYSSCKTVNEGHVTTFNMNGCSYLLGVANAGPPYVGDVELACAKEGAIEIVTDPPVVGTCTYTIPAQNLGPVAYQNLGTGASRHLAVEVEGKGIDYTRSEVSFGCLGGTGSFKNGTLTGGVTLEGPNR